MIHQLKRLCAKAAVMATVLFIGVTGNHLEASAKDAEGNIVIVIDPGHGGDDPGKPGVTGVYEADVNYEIARAMMSRLEQFENVRVYLTRPEEGWITNTGRAMVAANLNADFLISLHNNSGTETSSGAIVYTSVLPLYSTITADMGNYILGNLEQLGIQNNGIQTRNSTEYIGEDYYTIMGEGMRAGVPTVLVEHCFLSNPVDSLFVSHEDGSLDYDKIGQIGKADADAVIDYFNLKAYSATADSKSSIELEKGYSVRIVPENTGTGNITWLSSNVNAVQVDEHGLATAVNSGVSTIQYSYEDGTTGTLSIKVNIPEQVALVGFIDPTFYSTPEELVGLDLSTVRANVVYSDGSVKQVTPDHVGEFDYNKIGIQDVDISYGALTGSVRIIYNSSDYVPEVTSKETEAPTEESTAAPQETEDVTQTSVEESTKAEEKGDSFDIMMIIKLGAGVVIVVVIGTVVFFLENRMSRSRRRNRRRRRY